MASLPELPGTGNKIHDNKGKIVEPPPDIIGAKDTLIPLLLAFLPAYNKLIGESTKIRLPYQEEKRLLLEAGRMLISAIGRKLPYFATQTEQDHENFEPNGIFEGTATGIRILCPAYRPEIRNSLLVGRDILLGSDKFKIHTPAQISSAMKAASALLIEDQEMFVEALEEYPVETKKEIKYSLKDLANNPDNPNAEYYASLLHNLGNLAAEASAVFTLLQNAIVGGTYNPLIRNSILVGGDSVLYGAGGGKITDSIIAANDRFDPLKCAVDVHVTNSYFVTPAGMTYIEDANVGKYAGEIDWHGFPDFHMLFDKV